MRKIIVPVGIGILAIWAIRKWSKGAALSRLKLSIIGVQLTGSFTSPEVKVEILAQNPTNEDISVTAMVADIFINGTLLGNASNFIPFVIQPATETVFTVRVRLNVAGIFSEIADILKGTGGIKATVKVVGTINLEKTIVPIDLTHKII